MLDAVSHIYGEQIGEMRGPRGLNTQPAFLIITTNSTIDMEDIGQRKRPKSHLTILFLVLFVFSLSCLVVPLAEL